MKTIIEDTRFPAATRIRIGGGPDELMFVRCSFEGGEIVIEREVDRTVFSQCVFRGTRFSGQSLSNRIADTCHTVLSYTEETAPPPAARAGRFRN
ncbi:MAG TPA: hypothetical protein VFN42_14620 [Acetobacteraceae bacterium]|nr:hypothetical protein [Acetobacteraceae bacterium]HQT78375.1 hypothetical protein [Rhodopila sp.]